MAQDITSVQRDLADLQKQAKQLSDKIKNESDPTRKAILQKKLIDLNTKKANLNKEMEDLVTSIGVGQELEFAEGFTKWNKYKKSKMKKLTEQEKLKVKNFAKGLVEKNVVKEQIELPTEVFTVVKDIGIKPSDVTSYRIIDKKHVIEFKIHNLTLDLPTIKHHKITDLVVTNGEAELQFRAY